MALQRAPKEKIEEFKNGSTWLKVDFHLHTNEDKEFSYSGEKNQYIDSYVEGLKNSGTRIGAITNHNKFVLSEFKALRKAARKKGIFLLPGLELSVKDGSNGVHTLVIFSEEWIINRENEDYINSFLNVSFAGQANCENKNARSNHDLMMTITELDRFAKDYFLVFAHVEADNGLWGSLSGGRLEELGNQKSFRDKTLAFQKVRTYDEKSKVESWFHGWYPAEVEGSDCKSIKQIESGQFCFLKIGEFTFEAIKYALMAHKDRVSSEPKKYNHSFVRSISFEGGVLNGQTIHFSPELNSLIGIRGSGKSSILEAIRYLLDISFGDKSSDRKYKELLIQHTFGSGGKAVICAVDRHGTEYEIRRILNEHADVYVNNDHQPGIKIRETVLRKPIYFGQKDLSSTGEGFEKDLVEKLVGEKLIDIRSKINAQKIKVGEAIDRLQNLSQVENRKKEYETKQQDAEFRLKIFKEHGIEEKLESQINHNSDARKIKQVVDFVNGYAAELTDFLSRFEDDFNNLKTYKSKQNRAFFEDFFAIYGKLLNAFLSQKQALTVSKSVISELQAKTKEFESLKKDLVEEFARIERNLSEELKEKGASSIRPDEFLKLRKTVDQAKQMLSVLEKQHSQKTVLANDLFKELTILNELWHSEYQSIQIELNKVNEANSALAIESEFKGDKDAFVSFMTDMFRGSRIRENTLAALVDDFSDFGAMYKDFEKAKSNAGSSPEVFEKYFLDSLKSLLIWQIPNRYRIKYHEKELKHHSLGQRASALILFILGQRENDVIMIDQPEDDLDNQTIYEDVIKLIRIMKNKTQFIFATHNANLPVLGDSEQIHSCRYEDDNISLKSGSIDSPALQNEIVDIMEGGEEAFNKRKEIYQIWNPQSS